MLWPPLLGRTRCARGAAVSTLSTHRTPPPRGWELQPSPAPATSAVALDSDRDSHSWMLGLEHAGDELESAVELAKRPAEVDRREARTDKIRLTGRRASRPPSRTPRRAQPCEVSERLQEAQRQQARQARVPALRGSFAASFAQAVSSGSAARPAEVCGVTNRQRQPASWDGGRGSGERRLLETRFALRPVGSVSWPHAAAVGGARCGR
jgi:hypothetical protein